MKKQKNKLKIYSTVFLAVFTLGISACTKDYLDPNRATEDQVFSSIAGLTGAAISLQNTFTSGGASSLSYMVDLNGLTTGELLLVNSGNGNELELITGGGAVTGGNTVLKGLWTNSNKMIFDADKVIAAAEKLDDKSYASGLIAYSTIFKALALGHLSMNWEKIPDGVGLNVNFINRVDGFNRAIADIEKAQAGIAANAINPVFLSRIPGGIDIPNTLNALKARFALFAGNNALALTSANNVDLTKKSVLAFDVATPNPVAVLIQGNNLYQPRNINMGLEGIFQPDPADKRVAFYITPAVKAAGFGATLTTAFPIYLPGEITLIKAEAYTRQQDLVNGLIELNKVVTKKAANDVFGVGADLSPLVSLSQTDLLDQIYKNRCIELYMSGLKLEDMRRFSRPMTERKRNFFPYPNVERDNNPNTPANPEL